jgi:multidrug resistance efflux pump
MPPLPSTGGLDLAPQNLFEAPAETIHPAAADLTRPALPAIPWGRLAKLGFGVLLLAFGALTTYQQLIVRATRDAVINARVAVVRAPIDGIVSAAIGIPGTKLAAGATIGRIEDPRPDDARLFALQQQQAATERERADLLRQLGDRQQARAQAEAQAEAYRLGRVREDELRVEEAEANLQAATARETDASAALARAEDLFARGFVAAAQHNQLQRARDVAQADALAAQKRLDALRVELAAARTGTYLGDNFNDVPSSTQRARELALRIAEIGRASCRERVLSCV